MTRVRMRRKETSRRVPMFLAWERGWMELPLTEAEKAIGESQGLNLRRDQFGAPKL